MTDAVPAAAATASGPPGTTSRRRLAAIYVGGVALPLGVTGWILILIGRHGSRTAPVAATPAVVFTTDRILLAVAVIVVVAHLGGALAARLHQPRVIGQAVAGLALGPSVLGAAAPQVQRWLHGGGSDQAVDLLAQLGVIMFVFLIGRELAAARRAPRPATAAALGASMTALPLLAGVITALVAFASDRPTDVGEAPYALFIGLLMAATALPVLAHILAERGLLTGPVGALATGAAAIGDVTVWCLLAVVLCLTRHQSLSAAAIRFAGAVAFLVFVWWVVRPVLRRVLPAAGATGPLVPAVLLSGLLVCAAVTDILGLHAIFGAFLFGLAVPAQTPAVARVAAMTEMVTEWLLLPLFFAAIGSRTHLADLRDPTVLAQAALVVVVASVGKFGSGAAIARMLAMRWRDSVAIGAMVNCRGMTELILLTIGRSAGIIDDRLFTIFVVMALVTTAMTGPVLSALRLPSPRHVARLPEPAGVGQR